MGYIPTQLIMAARSQDTESWMNIFFIVALAIFWLLGGIAKARAKKTEEPDKAGADLPAKAKPPGKRAQENLFRWAGRTRPVGAEPQRQTRRPSEAEATQPRIIHPRPVVQGPPVREKPVVQSAPQPPFVHPTRPPPISEPLTNLQQIRQPAVSPPAEVRSLPTGAPRGGLATDGRAELLLIPTDPDQLRSAILHYEILGKPLSLRRPSV